MQQKLCSRGSGSFLLERNSQAFGSIPDPAASRDPSFHSLGSLRCPLEDRRSYCSPHVFAGGFSITGKLPDPLITAIPWHDMSLPTRRGQQSTSVRPPHTRSLSDSRDSGYLPSYGSVRRRTQSVGVRTQTEDEEDNDEEEDYGEEEGSEEDNEGADGSGNETDVKMAHKRSEHCHHHTNHHHIPLPGPAPPGTASDHDPELVEQSSYSGLEMAAASTAASASVQQRLASILRAADGTMQRRLAEVSTELAQTDTELLCQHAHSQHLAQERQEVADRERSLSRQVDVAVMVIAALREQLNASENELERREREAITIQNFLEAAVRQETCGKVRIQHFIENLLRRIALAERLVEYYQVNGSPPQCHHLRPQQQTDTRPHRITKSRSAGGHLSSSSVHDNWNQCSFQRGGQPTSSKADRERLERLERLAQSSRLFCRPEHRDDIWNHQRRRSAGYEA